jgi:hypothetical protein
MRAKLCIALSSHSCTFVFRTLPQQFLYFLPLPHGQG